MPPVMAGDRIIDDNAHPIYYQTPRFGSLAYVPHMSDTLDLIGHADIYHVQGIWMFHGKQVADYARRYKKPYIVTLRGMLYPQALAHKSYIKRISMALYQRQVLKNAAAIQCTCIEEMEHYRRLGFTNPVAIIPNPIDVSGMIDRPILAKPIFRIGYLGRVHPRKRIERLIYAMSDLRYNLPENAELLIIGGGDEEYEAFLHNEVERLNLTNIRFAGFLSGQDKDDAINSLSLLVVPSDFENFGNIVTEALVHGVPVVTSTGMPWRELPENGCGWWIQNDQNSIDETVIEAFNLGPDGLKIMGIKGRDFVSEKYSVESLGKKMKSLYEWILGEIDKPEFVYD